MKISNVIIYETVEIDNPYLVIGFSGWPNAGEVSTGSLQYLKDRFNAKKLGEILSDSFYNFSTLRPTTVIENGYIKKTSMVTNDIFYCRNEKSHKDLFIIIAEEPHLRWNEYNKAIIDFAKHYGIKEIYVIGGTYDNILHTTEPKVSAVTNDDLFKDKLIKNGIELISYTGPCSIHTLILEAGNKAHIPSVSLWGHVPPYIQRNPKAFYAVLKKLLILLEMDFNIEELKYAANALDDQINTIISQNPTLKKYIKDLKTKQNAGQDLHRPVKFDKVIRIEKFLKKGKRDTEKE